MRRRLFLQSALFCTTFTFAKESYKKELVTLEALMHLMLPKSKELKTNIEPYFSYYMAHPKIRSQEKEFLLNSIAWIEKSARKHFQKDFHRLFEAQKEQIIKNIFKQSWSESWFETIMQFFLEAMFSDPLYGSNRSANSWKWISFIPGKPRPKKIYYGI